MLKNSERTMDKIVGLRKNRGFVYSDSEIYGGLFNTWDYGPLGVESKNNIKAAWRKKLVQESPYNVGLDSATLMNPQVWVASGHVGGFPDPLMDCRDCHTRHRADKLIEEAGGDANGTTFEQISDYIKEHDIARPDCGSKDFTDICKFSLMFKTFQGVTEDAKSGIFLCPEAVQGIFVGFVSIRRTTRRKIPFGAAQIGKSFRNEITPSNFMFRTREFEQTELEFFCKPDTDLDWFYYWKDYCKGWFLNFDLNEENLCLRDHEKEELFFYPRVTTDIESLFLFGWGELWSIADCTGYDLKQRQNHSGKALDYFDSESNERYIPYIIEPSFGADRVALVLLCDAHDEEEFGESDSRIVMHLRPALASYKVAILPPSKKLDEEAQEVHAELAKHSTINYDDAGSIGKRYRRQDEIGTPFCLTYDFESETDGCVTIRDRDTMQQERVSIDKLVEYIEAKIEF